MRRVVAAAVGLLVMLGARPSWGGGVEPVRLPDGSALSAVEFDRPVAACSADSVAKPGAATGHYRGGAG
jgi:hypothetical protein